MRVKKIINFQALAKSEKAAASNPTPKGSKKQATRVDPYAAEMQICEESTVKEEMLTKLHEDGLLLSHPKISILGCDLENTK